jgi:hypothetical protein
MQLEAIELSGVKGFASSQRLDFADANLIFGANSSGKSSILQTLLLLQQSSLRAFSAERGFLEFRGPAVDLGGFRTFVNMHDTSRAIEVALSVSDADTSSAMSLGKDLKLSLRFELSERSPVDPELSRVALVAPDFDVTFTRTASGPLALDGAASASAIVDRYFASLLAMEPRSRRTGFPTPEERDRRWLRDWLRGQTCSTHGWLPYWPVTTVAGRPGRPVGGTKGSSRNQLAETLVVWWLNYINDLSFDLYSLLNDLVYVGPLREFPRRVVSEATDGRGGRRPRRTPRAAPCAAHRVGEFGKPSVRGNGDPLQPRGRHSSDRPDRGRSG